MTISALLGMSIERLAYKPLRKASRIAVLITAIGASFFLEYTGVFVLGPQAKGFPEILNKHQYTLFGSSIQVDSNQIIIGVGMMHHMHRLLNAKHSPFVRRKLTNTIKSCGVNLSIELVRYEDHSPRRKLL